MARDYIAAVMMCLEIFEWVEFPPEAAAKLIFIQSLGAANKTRWLSVPIPSRLISICFRTIVSSPLLILPRLD